MHFHLLLIIQGTFKSIYRVRTSVLPISGNNLLLLTIFYMTFSSTMTVKNSVQLLRRPKLSTKILQIPRLFRDDSESFVKHNPHRIYTSCRCSMVAVLTAMVRLVAMLIGLVTRPEWRHGIHEVRFIRKFLPKGVDASETQVRAHTRMTCAGTWLWPTVKSATGEYHVPE